MNKHYSIQDFFARGSVLLTGSSGYVGGLCLEKLLRCTDVTKVYVLLRQKRGEDIQTRLHKMLSQSPLFHLLRDNPVLGKVQALAGNMLLPGLGIGLEDRQLLQREVQTVIHCAADIRLEVGIQDLLQANYEGTKQLLNLARSFSNLQAFVHVSSAYTNVNAPTGSLVKEAIYPVSHGDQPIVHQDLVQELLGLPAHNANLRAEGLLAAWNFPNNYTLSKHLAEYMVADYHKAFQMPIAIVRPTLISSVARDPYPGYTGNFAGHVGATLAFMVGLFNSPATSNYKASNVWDVIPADVTANLILATAAALGQGFAARCCVTPTCHGRIIDSSSSIAHEQPAPLKRSSSAHLPQRVAASVDRTTSVPAGMGPVPLVACNLSFLEHHSKQQKEQQQQLLIIHCGSSTIYPLTIMESWNWGVEVYGAWSRVPSLTWGCAGPMKPDHEPNASVASMHMALIGWKIWCAAKLLSWFKMDKVARKLLIGFESFKVINQPKTDCNLRFSTNNMQRLAALLHPSEQNAFLLLWKPQHRGASAAVSAAGTPAVLSRAPSGLATVFSNKAEGFAFADQPHFSDGEDGAHMIKAAADAGIERKPVLKCLAPASSSSSRSSMSSDPEDGGSSDNDSDAATGSSILQCGAPKKHHGAELSPESEAEVVKMRAIPVDWRSFHISLGAYLYCSQFKMPLPPTVMPIKRPEVARWLKIKPEDQVIRHHFKLYA